MKAFQFVEVQKPAELREVPVPEPGAGQVLIKIGGAGACHSGPAHPRSTAEAWAETCPLHLRPRERRMGGPRATGFAKEEADPDGADVIYTASGVSNVPASFVCADS